MKMMGLIGVYDITISTVQMKGKFGGLSQCSSQQNFSLPYYYPLSPLSKITTPHRPRPNHSTSYASPIAFLTANPHDRSPQGKENQGVSLNQSPITNSFNHKLGERNDHGRRPISNVSKNLPGRPSYHNFHKSEPNTEGMEGQFINFEQTLKSITQKSPQGQPKTKSKMSFSNNFQGILEAQDYEIMQKGLQCRKIQQPFAKKASFQSQKCDERLFNSCLRNSDKRGFPQPQRKEQLLCMNDDGNIAKYITIASEDDDERLYYCSKCTVLLVNQGFVLEEIKKNKIQQSVQAETFADVSQKIQACRDKLGSLINDLSMREEFEVAKIGQFYDSLAEVLEKCKKQGQSQIKSLYKQKIQEYQQILQEVDVFAQNIKETQQNLAQFEGLHQQILKFSLGGPFLNKYDTPQLNKLQQAFSNIMQEQFTLTSKLQPISKTPDPQQTSVGRNHGLRFSFQKLLHDISSKKSKMQDIIGSLPEEQESESFQGGTQKTAFRDLFPDDSCQINSSVNSPTFKHI